VVATTAAVTWQALLLLLLPMLSTLLHSGQSMVLCLNTPCLTPMFEAPSCGPLTLHEAHSQVLQHDTVTARKERQHILDEMLLSTCRGNTPPQHSRAQCRDQQKS
jgi:hypothetical protein